MAPEAPHTPRTALVAGASGFIGRRVAEHLVARGWRVVAASRRPPDVAGARPLAVDLADARAAREALSGLPEVTHVFYCVRADHPEGVPESEERNVAMLVNLLDALEPAARRLEHVSLVHGTKYYGHHQGPCPVPVVEESLRGPGPTFYFAQEDLVRERAPRGGWHFSIVRPHIFCDARSRHPRSIGLVIAVLAAVHRELGEPLFFPGTPRAYSVHTQFTELGLLARALEWMATAPQCADQAFNVVNGDHPRWCDLWPKLAALLDIEAGPPRPVSLAQSMPEKAAAWDAVVRRHGLERNALSGIVLWDYADYVFRPQWDIISSMDRARRLGFGERVDTVQMFGELFAAYRERRLIPRARCEPQEERS